MAMKRWTPWLKTQQFEIEARREADRGKINLHPLQAAYSLPERAAETPILPERANSGR